MTSTSQAAAPIDVAWEENQPLLTSGPDRAKQDQPDYDVEMARHGGPCTSKTTVGQVTIRLPIQWTPMNILAITFSFVPWFIPLLLLAYFVCTLNIASLVLLFLLGFCCLLNEFALKPLIGQPRPETTANRDAEGKPLPGMPSGHVTISQTCGIWCVAIAALSFSLIAASITIVCLVASMVAVAWARWYNGDHSAEQVVTTAILSTIIGSVTFAIYYCCFAYTHGLYVSFS